MSETDEKITGGDAANGVGLHSVVMRRRAIARRWRKIADDEWENEDGSKAYRRSCADHYLGGMPGWDLWTGGRFHGPFVYFDELKTYHAAKRPHNVSGEAPDQKV